MKTFEDFLQAEHFKEYHGCKDDYDDAFDNWLGSLDTNEMLEYGEKAILEAQKEAMNAVIPEKKKLPKKILITDEIIRDVIRGFMVKEQGYNQAVEDSENRRDKFLTK